MPRFALALASALLVIATSAATVSAKKPTKLPALKDTTIVEGQSLGGVKLGGTKAAAVKAWGKPGTCSAGSCNWPSYKGGLSIVLNNGKITLIVANLSPGLAPNVRARILPLHTGTGVRLRDGLDKVKQLYPAARGFGVGAETTLPALELISGTTFTDFFFNANRVLQKISVSTQSAAHPV